MAVGEWRGGGGFNRSNRVTNRVQRVEGVVESDIKSERAGQAGDSCVMVIFGASGDLTKRKLIPSLYNLSRSNLLPREFAVVGSASSEINTEEFRKKIRQSLGEYGGGPCVNSNTNPAGAGVGWPRRWRDPRPPAESVGSDADA